MVRAIWFAAVLAAITALQLIAQITMARPSCDFVEIAEKHIVKLFPRYDLKELKQVISDNGKLWELTYELPDTVLGGVPIITIDKRTCKVIRIVHTQ